MQIGQLAVLMQSRFQTQDLEHPESILGYQICHAHNPVPQTWQAVQAVPKIGVCACMTVPWAADTMNRCTTFEKPTNEVMPLL